MEEIFSVSIEESVAQPLSKKVPEARRPTPSGKSFEVRSGPTVVDSGFSLYSPEEHAPFRPAQLDRRSPPPNQSSPISEEPFLPANEAEEVREAFDGRDPSEWDEGQSVSSEKSVDEFQSEAIDDPDSDYRYLEYQAKKKERLESETPGAQPSEPADSFLNDRSEFYAFQRTKRKRQSEHSEEPCHRDLLEAMVESDQAKLECDSSLRQYPQVKDEQRSAAEGVSTSHLSDEQEEEDPEVSKHRYGLICEAHESCNSLIEQAASFRVRHLGRFRAPLPRPNDRKRAILKRLRKDLRLLERLLENAN